MTQTVPDISPLMPMHQDPLLVSIFKQPMVIIEVWVHVQCCNICSCQNFQKSNQLASAHSPLVTTWTNFSLLWDISIYLCTVYPKKYAHGFCFGVLCCGYTLTDFPKSIRLTSLALWPSASKATLMNMDKYFMWIHYERLHNHNKAKHNKTVCIFLGIYCIPSSVRTFTFNNPL